MSKMHLSVIFDTHSINTDTETRKSLAELVTHRACYPSPCLFS